MRPALIAISLVVAGGCGGPLAQLRSDNHRLAGDLDAARAELRAERRKRKDLENQVLVMTDRLDTAAVHGRVVAAPPPALPVEVLGPDDVPERGALVGYDDSGSGIVYVGAAAAPSVELDTRDLRDGDRRPVPAPRPTRGDRPRRSDLRDLPTSTELVDRGEASADGALDLYRAGQAALKARDYATAIARFRELIARYPSHDYADNAQYWLGEVFYDQKDYAHALTEFRATVSTYPMGNKVPDALLKIGLSYAALGDADKARAALEQVQRQFPKSSPATIAATRLEQLP
ncbi:MAG: tol-pal system protein YbgF [Kofleriaceae bacterium]